MHGISILQFEVPSEISVLLNPLLKLLPYSLNRKHLLVHAAWQAAYARNVSPHLIILCSMHYNTIHLGICIKSTICE